VRTCTCIWEERGEEGVETAERLKEYEEQAGKLFPRPDPEISKRLSAMHLVPSFVRYADVQLNKEQDRTG